MVSSALPDLLGERTKCGEAVAAGCSSWLSKLGISSVGEERTKSADENTSKCSRLPRVMTWESKQRGGGARGRKGGALEKKKTGKKSILKWLKFADKITAGLFQRPSINEVVTVANYLQEFTTLILLLELKLMDLLPAW